MLARYGHILVATSLLIAVFTNFSFATIRVVNRDGSMSYSTIQLAIDACVDGDTVLVSPRFSYSENLTISHSISMIGAGFLPALSGGSENGGDVMIAAPNVTIVGMRFGRGIRINSSCSAYITRCYFEGVYVGYGGGSTIRSTSMLPSIFDRCVILPTWYTSNGSIVESDGPIILTNSLFLSHPEFSGNGTVNVSTNSTVRNCVFRRVNLIGEQSIVENCISIESSIPAVSQYCSALGVSVPANRNNIQLGDNPFVSDTARSNFPQSLNLHLPPSSPCVDAGNPLTSMNDRDGSRNDMGIYGGSNPFVDNGAPEYPFVLALTIPTVIPAGQPLQIDATGRIGQR